MTVEMLRDIAFPAVGVGVLGVEGIDSDFDVGIIKQALLVFGCNPQPESISGTIAFGQGKVDKEDGCSAVQLQAVVV